MCAIDYRSCCRQPVDPAHIDRGLAILQQIVFGWLVVSGQCTYTSTSDTPRCDLASVIMSNTLA